MTINPSQVPRAQVFTGPRAEARAQQLGIAGGTDPLVAALRDGASGARATTPMHPLPYKGQRMWGETVASLGTRLLPVWSHEVYRGVDLVLNRFRGVAIIVTAGDSATGKENYFPQVRFDRGEAVQGIANGELDQLWGSTPTRPEWDVWFLLHFLQGNSLTGELSRPSRIGPGGWVTGWSERIILPDTTFGGAKPRSRQGDDAPPAVEVDVQRRTG
jgi:hypothetical protein